MIYFDLFFTFFKIGIFTIGGGYAMLPLIQSEALSKGWMTLEEMVNFIAVSESTPGPFAVNIATYVGTETGGLFGAFCATLGVILPSFIIILIIAKFFHTFKNTKIVRGCMSGLKVAVVSLIASSVISIASSLFFSSGLSLASLGSYAFISSLITFIITLLITFLITFKKLHPIFVITISAILGIASGYLGIGIGAF